MTHAPQLVADRQATLEALVAGRVSVDQADIICRAIDQFPLYPVLRDEGEQALLGEAGNLSATELRKTAAHLIELVDPDKAERRAEADLDREDRAAHLGRTFTVIDDGAGGVRIRGRGSLEDGAVLRAALLPLTTPFPRSTPTTRPGQSTIPVTTAPGCGTPWSDSPSTPSTPTTNPPPTAPGPGSVSWSISTTSSPGSGRSRTTSTTRATRRTAKRTTVSGCHGSGR